MCAAAYGSHLLMIGSASIFIRRPAFKSSGRSIATTMSRGSMCFGRRSASTCSGRATLYTNVTALLQEGAILVPTAAVLWLARVKALGRLAPQMAGTSPRKTRN
jgi:hypothetical protein